MIFAILKNKSKPDFWQRITENLQNDKERRFSSHMFGVVDVRRHQIDYSKKKL